MNRKIATELAAGTILIITIIIGGLIWLGSEQQAKQNQAVAPVPVMDKKINYQDCLKSNEDLTGAYEPGFVVINFFKGVSNQKANELLSSLNIEERLNVDVDKTESIYLRIERDKKNVFSTYFRDSTEEYFQKYWSEQLAINIAAEMTNKVTAGDNKILKKISEDNQDILDCTFKPCNINSTGTILYYYDSECKPYYNCKKLVNEGSMHLKNKLSRKEIEQRFGHYADVFIDYEKTFGSVSSDYILKIKVPEGDEIPRMCQLKNLDSDIISYVSLNIYAGLD